MVRKSLSSHDASFASQVRDGSYFTNAKSWYRSEFVVPIAQRSWMVLICGASVFCALASIFALLSLLPVKERPSIVTYIQDIDDYRIRGERMRAAGEDPTLAVLDFFVDTYVHRRESYVPLRYQDYFNFVKAYSSEEVYAQYAAIFGEENPRSLKNVLADQGSRVIEIIDQKMHYDGVKAVATVIFKAKFYAEDLDIPSSRWQVKLHAYYRPMQTAEEIDVIGSDVKLDIKPPSFKVSNYELTQIK